MFWQHIIKHMTYYNNISENQTDACQSTKAALQVVFSGKPAVHSVAHNTPIRFVGMQSKFSDHDSSRQQKPASQLYSRLNNAARPSIKSKLKTQPIR